MKTLIKSAVLSLAALAAGTSFAQQGWNAEYFNWGHYSHQINAPRQVFFETPALTRWEHRIANNWGDGSPDWRIGADYFAARYQSTQYFATSGTYNFNATVDDGVRIFVDGQQITPESEWRVWSRRSVKSSIYLGAGYHHVMVEYFERDGLAEINIDWQLQYQPPAPTAQVGIQFNCLPVWSEQAPYYLMVFRIEANGAQTLIPQIFPNGSSNPNGVWANNGGVLTVRPLTPYAYYRVIFGRGADHLQEQVIYVGYETVQSNFGNYLIQPWEKASLPGCY